MDNMTGTPGRPRTGYHMIRSIEIHNFRCYDMLTLKNCAPINVIIGDNGTGKTTLLEAIFLPLATGSDVAMRLRQQRGLDGAFNGAPRRIEEAAWGDFFHDSNMDKPIRLALSGDGPDGRSLEIARGAGETTLALTGGSGMPEPVSSSPVIFIWKDAKGVSHTVTPKFSAAGISLPDTGEDMPDFYYFAATVMVGSIENAGRFSELSKANRHKQFVQTFTKEYPWIRDLNVEVHAGSPAVFATLKGSNRKIPVANISTGINRALGFMLAIALRPRAIVLIDEIENGIHYAHLAAIWRSILSLAREYETQLFISTHSRECLEPGFPGWIRISLYRKAECGMNISVLSSTRGARGWNTQRVNRMMGLCGSISIGG